MKFYISWTKSDPVYSNYLSKTNILISPSNLSTSTGVIKKWKQKPSQLIVDSGAYYFINKKKDFPLQREIFKKQLQIIKDTNVPCIICHLDRPISYNSKTHSNSYLAIEKTLNNAYEFLSLYYKYGLDKNENIKSLGVIQGTTKDSIQFCAKELRNLEFDYFGLGSLANLYSKDKILSRIKYTTEVIFGNRLHLFGISRMDLEETFSKYNIRSIDSSRPAFAAIYRKVFYSNPFRTYGIITAKNSKNLTKVINEPLKCNCPVCKVNPKLLMNPDSSKGVKARTLHNYYHLLKSIDKNFKPIIINTFK